MKLIFATSLLALSFNVFAAEPAKTEHMDHKAMMEQKLKEIPECKAITEQCEGAGYKVGEHKDGKGLMMDCIGGIAHGKKVDKVTATADDAKKCHEAAMKMKHEHHHEH